MSTDLFHQVMSLDLGLIVLTVTCMLVSWSLPAGAFEMSTTEAPCPPGYYTCETGFCIPNSWICDGDLDCVGGSDERDCPSTTVYSSSSSASHTTDDTEQPSTTYPTTTTQSTTTPGNDCFRPFQSVGGRCVFVDPFVEGSWREMRYRCEEFGSVLLEVEEPNFFLSVVQFIKEKGLEGTSYWIGGRKDADDDLYYWDGSRTNVTMGTPFWAIYQVSTLAYYEQEPDASGVEQCILLNKDRKMYFSDMDCDAAVAGVVCQRDPGPVNSPPDLVTRCHLDNFACDFSACVSRFKVCDGVKDCRDNADEAYCQGARSTEGVNTLCGDTQFECDNGNCVWNEYVCDGDNDCYDFSDERNCDATTTTVNSESPTPLPSKASLTIVDAAPSPSTSSAEVVSNTNTRSASEDCTFSPPYQSVGGKCIFVEPFVEGSWEQMRYRCANFEGILLEMGDPNFFWAVVEYIIKNGIDNRDYWIGGRKDADVDNYYWDGSRTNVTMGTPFWAIYNGTSSGPYEQEPRTAAVDECVFLNKNRKLFFSATACDVTTAGVICQRPQNQSISIDVDDVIMWNGH